MKTLFASLVAILLVLPSTPARTADAIVETERNIPVAYDVDVVVVGGGVGAVTAAVEAKKAGASVFLAAPRPYLGEDVAGTLRLWLEKGQVPESALEKKLFERTDPLTGFPNRVPFTYEVDQVPNRVHPDPKNAVLTDGKWQIASHESVQYDADATIVADLGKMTRIEALHLMSFQRTGEFVIEDVEVWTSPNGTLWRDLGKIEDVSVDGGGDASVHFSLSVKQPCRYVKLLVRKAEEAQRILLGELLLLEERDVVVEPDAVSPPATPMQVKVALDDALLEAGVEYLYGAMITDILEDASGQPAGIVMANRNGRQAVRARVVIDATARAVAARLAGAEFAAYPGGVQRFQRIVSGGEPQAGEGISVEETDVKFYSKEGPHPVYVYDLEIAMEDASAASFARAEVVARERTFDVALVDESDVLFQVPPDPMKGKASSAANSFDPATIELSCLQPEGVERLFVLGGCADVTREAAARQLEPLNQMRLGERVGAAAAELAKGSTPSGTVTVRSDSPEGSRRAGEVREFLNGARPTHEPGETILSKARSLPVLGSYDVVVAGGGTGGAPAAIGAGRQGASALVIEFQDHLGGVGTLGLISSYYHGYRKGFTSEIDDHVKALGGPKRKGGWNPVAKREVWRREGVGAGADVWFSTLACGALVEGDRVRGVVVATPQGRGVVLGKVVVDSTGNSDIAVAAGSDFITTSAEHVAMQGTGLSPRALGTGYNNTDYSFADESDPVGQWRMIIAARQKYRSNSYDISTFINSRERRRIVGDAFVSPLDIINQRTWHDTISLHDSNFDTHGYTVHPVFLIDFPDKKGMLAPVPYRALLPQGLDGILVTGLGISAHRDSMPILRMQACIQNQGYAAGVAAASIASDGIPTRSLDVNALQEHLVEIGSLPPEALEWSDSGEPSDDDLIAATESVVNEYRGLALLLEKHERSRPFLQAALKKAETPEHELVYANILGMIGDHGGVEILIDHVRSSDWDEGWNFRGMGQFGGSISPLDSHIIALGQSGDPKALPAILEKVATLDATREFSHHRAVAMALEAQRVPSTAEALGDLLSKEGMTGYAITDIAESRRQEERSQPLREIILARALYRCGDHEGIGERILKEYEQDLRGLFAQHAQAVLREGK